MKKSFYILAVCALFFVIAGGVLVVNAQTGKNYNSSKSNTSAVALAQETEDVLPEAGLTPASPFHVFERFGDWARLNVFTFNPVRKAEIKVEIADERLAELKTVVEAGASSEVVARAEGFVSARTEEVEQDLENLDAAGTNVAQATDKFLELSLKQQAVLERVLEKAPEQAKEALLKAIEVSRRGFENASEVALKQKEKGHLDEEKAREIFERSVEKLKAQVERRSEELKKKTDELGEVPPEFKALFEEKIKLLENQVFTVESRSELKDLRENVKDKIKEAAKAIREVRLDHEISGEGTEEALEEIEKERFKPQEKAREMISEAEEEIAEVESAILKAESRGIAIHENVRSLLENAKKHLAAAKLAFEEQNYGRAFGQAVAANHNAKSALKFMKFSLEGEDKVIKAIREAKEEIAELETEIEKVKAETGQVPEAALKMLQASREQLRLAEAAFGEGNLERAFRHAEAARRMAEHGEDVLDREEEVFERKQEFEERTLEQKIKLEERAAELKKDREELRREEDERKKELESDFLNRIESVLPTPVAPVAPIESEPEAAVPASVKVRITSAGFEPREVKVQKGGSVIWVNESGTAVWPASAVHPTHSAYPARGGCISSAFDACRRIENGGTYQFRFDEAGTWRYHNHLNPGMTGAVTVVE